jgi:hypothetical protein
MMRISRRLSDGILPHFAFSLLRIFAVDFFGLTRWNPITMLKSGEFAYIRLVGPVPRPAFCFDGVLKTVTTCRLMAATALAMSGRKEAKAGK